MPFCKTKLELPKIPKLAKGGVIEDISNNELPDDREVVIP